MVTTMRTIAVAPGSELDRALAETKGNPLVLVRDGQRYRVQRELIGSDPADILAGYDPVRVRKELTEIDGSWEGIVTEALIADVHAQRGQDSRGRLGVLASWRPGVLE